MKNIKVIFSAFFLLWMASCSDPCKDISCLNGGACNDGECVCPVGYSGEFCENYDPCHNVTCLNGGICVNGACDCPAGYQGSDCGTAINAKYVGFYDLDEFCSTTGQFNYSVRIELSSDPSRIIFYGLWDELATAVWGDLTDAGGFQVDIALQTFTNNNWMIGGSGSMNTQGEIDINYTIYDASDLSKIDECIATLTPR